MKNVQTHFGYFILWRLLSIKNMLDCFAFGLAKRFRFLLMSCLVSLAYDLGFIVAKGKSPQSNPLRKKICVQKKVSRGQGQAPGVVIILVGVLDVLGQVLNWAGGPEIEFPNRYSHCVLSNHLATLGIGTQCAEVIEWSIIKPSGNYRWLNSDDYSKKFWHCFVEMFLQKYIKTSNFIQLQTTI